MILKFKLKLIENLLGTLEIIPCSHVGHIFRKRSPYKWRTGVNVLRRNSIRLAGEEFFNCELIAIFNN